MVHCKALRFLKNDNLRPPLCSSGCPASCGQRGRRRMPVVRAVNDEEPVEDSHKFYVVDGSPAELQQDWRLFRAQLVAKEMNQGNSIVKNTKLRPFDVWAHPIAQPEAGCLLLARQSGLGMFSHSIVLITEHDELSGTSGFILNMPTPIFISNLGLEEVITDAFGQCPLFLGGPMTRNLLHVIHGRSDVEGSMCIVEGVYAGGVESASEMVREGRASPSEFRLLAGYSGWAPGQLMQEIGNGAWFVVAASHTLILRCINETALWNCQRTGTTSHEEVKFRSWQRILQAAGIISNQMP